VNEPVKDAVTGARQARTPLDYVMLVGAAVIYGAVFSVNKMAATGGAPPLAYAFWQSFGAGVVLWIVLTLRGERLDLSRPALTSYLVIGALVSGLPISLLTYIAPKLPAGVMTLVLALSPPFTFAISVLARVERFRWLGLIGLLFGFAGVVLIVAPGASLGGGEGWKWFLLALLAPVMFAASNVSAAVLRPPASSSVATGAGVMLGSAAVLLPIMLLAGQAWFPTKLSLGLSPVQRRSSLNRRPAGVDHQGRAVYSRGIVGGEKHRGPGHFLDRQKIATGRRQRPHQTDVVFVAGPAQMRVQRGCDITRPERVDVDVLLAELGGERLGQNLQAAFGSAISRAVRKRADAGNRGDVDHLAAAFFLKFRQHGFDAEERAAKIEVELLVPNSLRGFRNRHGAEHAGIVDQDVDGAEMLDHFGDHVLDLRHFRTISLDRFGVAAGAANPLHHGGRPRVIAVVHDCDPRTLDAVTNRNCFADTLRSTGDDRDLAFELHCAPPRAS
jgi:drug/metabolite transporter (DMT)-like permease